MKNKKSIKITIKSIIIALLCIVLLKNTVKAIDTIQAVNSADLYSVGDCGQLLKYNGSIIRTTYVAYGSNGTEYPAYCLNVSLPGVGEVGNYTVTSSGNITDINLWRRVISGYPYKSIEELGVANKFEAFTATKQAIYCYLYNRGTENYTAIGDAGQRTLNALNKIINNSNNSEESKISNYVEIMTNEAKWNTDNLNKDYVSKTYNVTGRAEISNYAINTSGTLPEGTIITDVNNIQRTEFQANESFKIMIPIHNMQNNGQFTLNVETQMKTKPVLYGVAPSTEYQDYALTAYTYEQTTGTYSEIYGKNQTTIKIIKQDKNTLARLQGTEFSLLDENKNEIFTNLVTDENGEIGVTGLMPGKYYIKETKALDGYVAYDELIEVQIELNEKLTVTVNNSKETRIEIENTEKEIEVTQNKEVEIIENTKEIKTLPVTGM